MQLDAQVPRPEYPRPHLTRPHWLNLNGTWQFAFDDADRGLHDGWHIGGALPLQIVVPFSFEAPLSGLGDPSVHRVVWYRREVVIPPEFLRHRLLLHIGACDFLTRIWVNGQAAGEHRGGYSPIVCEVQDLVKAGVNAIVIRVQDDPVWTQPRGKQIVGDTPEGIDYDRVTGVWQTVWIEPVPGTYVEDLWTHFHLDGDRLIVRLQTNRDFSGDVEVALSFAGAHVADARAPLGGRREVGLTIHVPAPSLWSVDAPALYDLAVCLRCDDEIVDSVNSYVGLREFLVCDRQVLLNGDRFYLRGVLDQGYFPGGWYTAATDADLKRDIELMKSMGFNCARKHQKAEDPRWLAWADRLGLVVWGEMGNGREFGSVHVDDFTREWTQIVRRDRMHPCIMAWVPFNESWGVDRVADSVREQAWLRAVYHLTQTLDGSRPVLANDGWQFLVGDIWGVHNYVPDGPFLQQTLGELLAEPSRELVPGRCAALPGIDVTRVPVMLTEFGGVAFGSEAAPAKGSWGYDIVKDAAGLEHRVRELVRAVRAHSEFVGFVWTQLTDVQQEINGLLHFDRTPKLPVATYRSIFGG